MKNKIIRCQTRRDPDIGIMRHNIKVAIITIFHEVQKNTLEINEGKTNLRREVETVRKKQM